MKGIFAKVDAKTQLTMSKADKKKYNAVLGNVFDLKKEYKIYNLSSKLRLFKDGPKVLFFEYFDKMYPTVHNFDKNVFKTVLLDEGAVGPLSRGADVMAPGVIKYQEQASKFKKNEVVGIEIIGKGIFAVGLALMDFEEVLQKKEGPVIEVYHTEGDSIDKI